MPHLREQWPSPEELAGLLSAARADPENELDSLLARVRPCLLSFFSRRVSVDAAEDLTQSALIRFAGAVPRIDPSRADRYIRTVARNLLRTDYGRRMRERQRTVPSDLGDTVESSDLADRRIEYEELARAVRRASLAELPPELRVLVAGLLHGFTQAELAEQLDLNPSTVRTRLLRARAILRAELRPYLDEGIKAGGFLSAAVLCGIRWGA